MNVSYLVGEYKEVFQKNFIKTSFLEKRLSHYMNIIDGEYITISLRTLNCFGDFNESDGRYCPLDEDEQISFMRKCKDEIREFTRDIDKKYKIVVLSDSSKLLNYISDIQNICVFPENIGHIGYGGNTSAISVTEEIFLKTIIDFNIIMEASHVYRFRTEHLYVTRFPWLAAVCSGKPFTDHEF